MTEGFAGAKGGLASNLCSESGCRGVEPVCRMHTRAVASVLMVELAVGDFASFPWSEGILNGSQDTATGWTWYPFHLKRNVFFRSWRACSPAGRQGRNSLVFLSFLLRDEGVFLWLPAQLTWRTACTLCSLYLKVLSAFLEISFPMFSVVISVHEATNR